MSEADTKLSTDHSVQSIEDLERLYKPVNPNSLAKEASYLTPAYRKWIERAPFFALATSGLDGLDCSPRGDRSDHVLRILDDRHIAIPDRRGNNRLDSLRNIIADPRVAMLFLIPGILECVRINGTASISTDPDLLRLFDGEANLPTTVIVVRLEAVYFQCARALMRSKLWEADSQASRDQVPTAGQMTKSALPDFDADTYDGALRARQKRTLY
ncbi:MAG: MSMEG_1061 family FMN-dependent PPOX-type flavoprotein [Pseudomonadota bacterium]